MMKQYLENTSEGSNEFWETELDGKFVSVNYGEIGTSGESSKKNWRTPEKAYLNFKQQILEKLEDGYVDPVNPIENLTLELTAYNDETFFHQYETGGVYYAAKNNLIVSTDSQFIYLFNLEGKELGRKRFDESGYFFGVFFFREVPNRNEVIVYVKYSDRINIVYVFDLSKQELELKKEINFEIPVKALFGDIEVTENEIWIGYSNGFSILNYEGEILSTFLSPQEKSSSSKVALNTKTKLVALSGHRNGAKAEVLIVNSKGEKQCSIESFVPVLCFNHKGDLLFIAKSISSELAIEIWDVKTGEQVREITRPPCGSSILSLDISPDDKKIFIRLRGIEVILVDIESEEIEWRKSRQALWAALSFYNENEFFMSVGNRIFAASLKDGEVTSRINGLAGTCTSLYYDLEEENLWLAGGKRVSCFNKDGEEIYVTEAEEFTTGASNKILLRKREESVPVYYFWLDLKTFEETPFVTGAYKSIYCNNEFIILSEANSSKEKKNTKLYGHDGKMNKEIKLKEPNTISLLNENTIVSTKEKKIELWNISEGELEFKRPKAHDDSISNCAVHHSKPYFITAAENTIKLWKKEEETEVLLDFCREEVVSIHAIKNLDQFIVIDEQGNFYSVDVESTSMKHLASLNAKIEKTYLSQTGKLFVVSEFLIYVVDVSSALNFGAII